jgi:hypothetical protein
VRLVEGLWYYDDRYAEDRKYRHKIDILIRKCRDRER